MGVGGVSEDGGREGGRVECVIRLNLQLSPLCRSAAVSG